MERSPDEYTQTRMEFGRRAVFTARAVKAILETLIGGYETLDSITKPKTGTGNTNPGTGTTTQGTENAEDRELNDSHYPYFIYDAIKSLDEMIAFTETQYI